MKLENFDSIKPATIDTDSLIREQNKSLWFEINIPADHANIIQAHTNNLTIVNPASISEADKFDWLISYQRTASSFRNTCFIRTQKYVYSSHNRPQIFQQLQKEINQAFGPFALPFPTTGPDGGWQFIPKIFLGGSSMKSALPPI